MLNTRDGTGLAGTYHYWGCTVSNRTMVALITTSEYFREQCPEFPRITLDLDKRAVKLDIYNDLPFVFFVYERPDPKTLTVFDERKVVSSNQERYTQWSVRDKTGYLGVLIISPAFNLMMGDQAGVAVFADNGLATGFGNFDQERWEDLYPDCEEDVKYPHNYALVEPTEGIWFKPKKSTRLLKAMSVYSVKLKFVLVSR